MGVSQIVGGASGILSTSSINRGPILGGIIGPSARPLIASKYTQLPGAFTARSPIGWGVVKNEAFLLANCDLEEVAQFGGGLSEIYSRSSENQ